MRMPLAHAVRTVGAGNVGKAAAVQDGADQLQAILAALVPDRGLGRGPIAGSVESLCRKVLGAADLPPRVEVT